MEIILASASPRRRNILDAAKIPYRVCPSMADESYSEEIAAEMVPELLARRKALSVSKDAAPDTVVIGADTVVIADGMLLGKPRCEEDAVCMLRALSGKSHAVISGIAVVRGDTCLSASVRTEVFMRQIREEEIRAYVKRDKPFDKAGAYGIQEAAGLFVERIEGDYYNVVGLPLCALGELLSQVGVPLFEEEA